MKHIVTILIAGLFLSDINAQHLLLLRDEGMSKLSLVNTKDNSIKWQIDVPPGRDLQLVGNGNVLIGTGNGFEGREIETGKKVFELTSMPGTIAARRLANGNTMLLGLNLEGREGIVLVEINDKNEKVQVISYPGFKYARLFRVTSNGTFLITADKQIIEGDREGKIIWRAAIEGHDSPHAWQAIRTSNGQTIVSTAGVFYRRHPPTPNRRARRRQPTLLLWLSEVGKW
jgi:hypothetical protein